MTASSSSPARPAARTRSWSGASKWPGAPPRDAERLEAAAPRDLFRDALLFSPLRRAGDRALPQNEGEAVARRRSDPSPPRRANGPTRAFASPSRRRARSRGDPRSAARPPGRGRPPTPAGDRDRRPRHRRRSGRTHRGLALRGARRRASGATRQRPDREGAEGFRQAGPPPPSDGAARVSADEAWARSGAAFAERRGDRPHTRE